VASEHDDGDGRSQCRTSRRSVKAEADALVQLLSAPAPSWGIDGVMDGFLIGQATEIVDSRRAAISRVLDAWTRPRP
jgi:hypothetical protein